ncbi:globin [Nitrococcus mobilis]|uniref:Globin domain-containing protein n=1 Tax=Nitrococcus mobilis Nb-231 TaxID=314278 RepID=A4BV89_9GAMM|nr:globin [Nitrococcus mobilis]EAR20356.1 hypothetical protein NB231_06775 [Nitrococcus mobilis Nb-231]
MGNATEQHAELFNDSYERCIDNPNPPGFLQRFYKVFLSSSEEVAEKFKNTDFEKQTRVLKASLYYLMLSCNGSPEAMAHLRRIACLHSRKQLDIRPELYDLWLASLLQAAREYDPRFDQQTETAWRQVLSHGIDFMKSRY